MADIIAGRVDLLDPLAHGATGTLWRAVDQRYSAICAAKVLRQRDGADVLRFVREQSVGTHAGHAISPHPHLLLPYTWVAEDDVVALLMPLLGGGTLSQALADHGALSPSLVAELLRQLLDALAAVHEAGWLHRDVKPANLLLEVTGTGMPHLRLTDFGIALHEEDARLTGTGLVPGTPGFMAPEALRGHPASPAQDVWAAGAVALSALDPGADPRTVDSSGLVRTPGIDGSGPELAVARGLATVLGDLLDEDPGRRPGAAEARDALTRLLAEGADDVGGTSGADASAAAPAASADPAFHAADGQPFEVFDQLEPLPIGGPGTGLALVPPDGPGALPVRGGGLHARLQQRAGERGDRPSPTPPTSAVEHPDVADVQDTTRSASSPGALGAAGTPAPVGTPEPEVPTRLLPSTPPAASTSAPSAASSNAVPSSFLARHGAAIPALLALGTLAIVMAIVLGFLAFRGSPSDGGSPTPPASPTESPSPSDVTDPTEEESASMESTASATSDDDPSTTVAPGDACQWNEEGTTGMGTDGRTLICTKSGDDAYTWEET